MSEGIARAIVTNTETDRMIGRLIEATDQLKERSERLEDQGNATRDVLSSLDNTLGKLTITLEHMDRRMTIMERAPNLTERVSTLEGRVKACEDTGEEWKGLRTLIHKWAIGIAGICVTAAVFGRDVAERLFGR